METLSRDLRYALRLLRQRPLFTLIAALSVAIGIGATTVIVSVINAVLLRPPAGVGAPERALEVGRSMGGQGFDTFSYPELLDMRAQARTIESVAGWRFTPLSMSAGPESERIIGLAVSAEYFPTLGLAPARGRFYTPAEDRDPGANPLVVLSYRFWQNRFAADPAIVGRTLDLNRRQFTVVGVAPEPFRGHLVGVQPDLYLPLTMWAVARPNFNFNERRSSWVTAVARLRSGATLEQANAELAAIFQRMPERAPDPRNQRSATASTLGSVPGPARVVVTAFLGLLLGLVALVLLITCANVAGMLIARATAREREIAIRLAIGSGRAAIARQLILESVLLFAIGGLGGLAIAQWGASALSAVQLPVPIPVELNFRPELRVLLFGFTLALVTGLLFGLAPALHASKAPVMSVLKSESAQRNSRAGRLRRAFVTTQLGLSLILLASAGLFLRSLQRALQIDAGFDGHDVQMVSLDLDMDGYDQLRGQLFYRALLERVRTLPGVTQAAFGDDLPLDLGISETSMFPEGWTDARGRDGIEAAFNRVGGDYFGTLRIKVLQGRGFTENDQAAAQRVAVVSRSFAETAWPGQQPIGRRLRLDPNGEEWLIVVGVVADVKHKTLMDATQPTVYLPVTQDYVSALTLLVRGRGVTPAALRAALLTVDPRLSMSLIQPLDQYTAIGTMPQRIAALLTSALGLLALLLSTLGVYGVIAFMVAQRTREIGTRMALGAARSDVLRLVLRDGARLAAPGLILGLLAALAIGRLIRSFILGVAPLDPLTFTTVPLALLAAVALACWTPARRAASIQPIQALKTE